MKYSTRLRGCLRSRVSTVLPPWRKGGKRLLQPPQRAIPCRLCRRIVAAYILASVFGVTLAVAAPYPPVTVEVKPIRVSAHVYYVEGDTGLASQENQGFNANAGFVVTNAGVIVFDALGTPALGQKLIEVIRSVTTQPIKRVIISHFHADHIYGLQAFKDIGAEVWGHRFGKDYLATEAPAARLAERRQSLAPWVNDTTHVVPADTWLDDETRFTLGGLTFHVYHVGPAHTPEDVAMLVEEDGVLFAGDLMFAGRIPFVGDADSRTWLTALEKIAGYQPKVIIGGHGPASRHAAADLTLTREYLLYLRQVMGEAVENFVPFAEAYDKADWSRFSHLPAFDAANRRNAYNTYLLMEREALQKRQ
jgi:glyoxylase-like metal-dependent hydrolase (beta-lactamase superfamily II)